MSNFYAQIYLFLLLNISMDTQILYDPPSVRCPSITCLGPTQRVIQLRGQCVRDSKLTSAADRERKMDRAREREKRATKPPVAGHSAPKIMAIKMATKMLNSQESHQIKQQTNIALRQLKIQFVLVIVVAGCASYCKNAKWPIILHL